MVVLALVFVPIFVVELPLLDVSTALENGDLTLSARNALQDISTIMEPEHQKHQDTHIFVEPTILIFRFLFHTTLRCGLYNGSDYTGKHYFATINQWEMMNTASFLYPNSTQSERLRTIRSIGSWYGEPTFTEHEQLIIPAKWCYGSVMIVLSLMYFLARLAAHMFMEHMSMAYIFDYLYKLLHVLVYVVMGGYLGLSISSSLSIRFRYEWVVLLGWTAIELFVAACLFDLDKFGGNRPPAPRVDLEAANLGAPPVELVTSVEGKLASSSETKSDEV